MVCRWLRGSTWRNTGWLCLRRLLKIWGWFEVFCPYSLFPRRIRLLLGGSAGKWWGGCRRYWMMLLLVIQRTGFDSRVNDITPFGCHGECLAVVVVAVEGAGNACSRVNVIQHERTHYPLNSTTMQQPASSTKHLTTLVHPFPRTSRGKLNDHVIHLTQQTAADSSSSATTASTGTTGTTLWLGAQFMAAYMAQTWPDGGKGASHQHVLELGGGVGFLS